MVSLGEFNQSPTPSVENWQMRPGLASPCLLLSLSSVQILILFIITLSIAQLYEPAPAEGHWAYHLLSEDTVTGRTETDDQQPGKLLLCFECAP